MWRIDESRYKVKKCHSVREILYTFSENPIVVLQMLQKSYFSDSEQQLQNILFDGTQDNWLVQRGSNKNPRSYWIFIENILIRYHTYTQK